MIGGARLQSILMLAALAGVACSKSGPSAPPAGYVKIDDMEGDSGGIIEWTPPSGALPGVWFTATDCTEYDRISPPPSQLAPGEWSYAELPEAYQTFPGVLSTHAARVRTTTPLGGVWGGNMGFDLATPPDADGERPAPVSAVPDGGAPGPGQPCRQPTTQDYPAVATDLSAYSGVTFWAMAAGGQQNMRVEITDVNVDPRGGICNAADRTDESNCYNGFRTTLTLTNTMTRYTVDFSALQQDPTWGYRPSPDIPDLQHVYQFVFEADQAFCLNAGSTSMCAGGGPPPLSFDLWVDDLYFVAK